MSFPKKITSALAWVGLAIVIAVPVVEIVRSKFVSNGAGEVAPVAEVKVLAKPVAKPSPTAEAEAAAATVVITPVKPVVQPAPAPVASSKPAVVPAAPVAQTAEQTPAAADAAPAGDAVKDYLVTNKTLPSYITTGSSAKRAATAESQPAPMTPAAQQLATNLSSAPSTDEPVAVAPSAAVPSDSSDQTAPTAVATADAPVATPMPAPVPMPASARPKVVPGQTVTEADLKDWKSGTLEDYLRQHNLLSSTTPDQGAGN